MTNWLSTFYSYPMSGSTEGWLLQPWDRAEEVTSMTGPDQTGRELSQGRGGEGGQRLGWDISLRVGSGSGPVRVPTVQPRGQAELWGWEQFEAMLGHGPVGGRAHG